MLEINSQFKNAIEVMEKTNKHLLITGKAGTGKSTLLNYFRGKTKKNILVAAPTGTAAVNIDGETIHTLFGFDSAVTYEEAKANAKKNKKRQKLFQNVDMVVIDEISMVRCDLMDCMDIALRVFRKSKVPFGGVQMVFIGDLFQLPPVAKRDEKSVLEQLYPSVYFFDSNVFKEIFVNKDNFEHIDLEKIYRQSDKGFIQVLNSIRNRSFTPLDLEKLNCRIVKDPENLTARNLIYLTSINAKADEINEINLNKIESPTKTYLANISGSFTKERVPTQEMLELKVGARVMMLNNDQGGKWVNGTLGWIIELHDDMITIDLDNGYKGNAGVYTWEVYHTQYDEKSRRITKDVVGSFTQIPVRLAWAITIHKSQGKTFDNVIIDLGKGAFSEGQTYVALSRSTSLEGINLVKPIRSSDIRVDFKISRFMLELNKKGLGNNQSFEEMMGVLHEALMNKSKVKISYMKNMEEVMEREIIPENIGEMEYLGNKFHGVYAYCEDVNAFRNFSVKKIVNVEKI